MGLLVAATARLALVLASLAAWLVNRYFSDHVKVKDTSQLISGMSNILQKMLKYFNGTTISTFSFSALLPSNFPVLLVL